MKKHIVPLILVIAALTTHCVYRTPQHKTGLYTSYKPYAAWAWFSGVQDTNDIKSQIDWLQSEGFGGVEISWIYPVDTLDSLSARPRFLTAEWAIPVIFAKKYADKVGMGCDFSFGASTPFNLVDLPEEDAYRPFNDSLPMATIKLQWDYPRPGRVLDYLNKNGVRRYIARINRGLEDALSGQASALCSGRWSFDNNYLWTEGMDRKFYNWYGYDIVPYFADSTLYDTINANVYYDYTRLLSDYLINDFYGPFADNASDAGAFSRIQTDYAPVDPLTVFSLADVPETGTGIYDSLFRRLPASAAAYGNKETVSAQAFRSLYGEGIWPGQAPYQKSEQLADLRLLADALFTNGVNQIIWNTMPYMTAGDTSASYHTTVYLGENAGFAGQLAGFNQYMTTVSTYMRKGKSYSDVAVYFPVEDLWMYGGETDSVKLSLPKELKGRQPLWVNNAMLSAASYSDSLLVCGGNTFSSLYIDVEYLEYESLRTILKLARQGLPVVLTGNTIQPGVGQNDNYSKWLYQLKSLENVETEFASLTGEKALIKHKALVEGSNIPDFWCREDNGEYYIFFGNPKSQDLRYPLEYKQGIVRGTVNIPVTFNANGRVTGQMLTFSANQSLLFKIDNEGNVENIDITFNTPGIP